MECAAEVLLQNPLYSVRGDQRSIFLQLKDNNRRKKRRGKVSKRAKLSEIERIKYVLENGKLKDYTHPREIDPYWGMLYKQYEHLVYIDMYYRTCLKNSKDHFKTPQEIHFAHKVLRIIEIRKAQLTRYMMNFMHLMYGAIMSSRFYGWMHHADDFTGMFNLVAMSAIRQLRFDISKTRCSVYFYQAFWLCGLSQAGQIRDRLKREQQDPNEISVNSPKHSYETENIEEMCFDNVTGLVDTHTNISEYFDDAIQESVKSEDEDTEIITAMIEEKAPIDESVLNVADNDSETPEDTLIGSSVDQIHESTTQLLTNLLKRFGIGIDYIYKATDQSLAKLATVIRKKLRKGDIVLTDREKELVKTALSLSRS